MGFFYAHNSYGYLCIMEVNKIEGEEAIKQVISECLATDMDLVYNRHHSPVRTIKGCTSFTYNTLFKGNVLTDVDFYEIRNEKGRIGFLAVNESIHVLRSFHINKRFRRNGKCDEFWEAVKEVLGDYFLGVIWNDNNRAVRFFENEGGKLVNKKDNVLCYEFKYDKICQQEV